MRRVVDDADHTKPDNVDTGPPRPTRPTTSPAYATWTFTGVGPSGGVFYPWVIFCFRNFPIWTGADQWALGNFPKFLVPLSQSPGPMLASSGGGTLGPVTALLIGAGITVCISAGVRFAKLERQKT